MSTRDRSGPVATVFRPALERLAAHQPPAVPAEQERPCRLAANESPYAALPEVRQAITAASELAHRYPDTGCGEVIEEISGRLGVPPGDIVVGAGSIGVLHALVAITCEPGTDVVFAWPSFEAYPTLVLLSGATPVAVPLRDGVHDLAAMAAAVTARTRLVVVCNPNNPTGTVVGRHDFDRFLGGVPEHCLVVVDEAYRDYSAEADTPDGLLLYRDWPNVVVLRTFSKAHGLAGLRIGFLVGHAAVCSAVRKAQVPYAVSRLAQAAAVASLRSSSEVSRRVHRVVAERTRVRQTLLERGWPVPPAHGNFVWLPVGGAAGGFATACLEAGVCVRCFPGEGVRVSIGTPPDNDRFLEVARQYQAESAIHPHTEQRPRRIGK